MQYKCECVRHRWCAGTTTRWRWTPTAWRTRGATAATGGWGRTSKRTSSRPSGSSPWPPASKHSLTAWCVSLAHESTLQRNCTKWCSCARPCLAESECGLVSAHAETALYLQDLCGDLRMAGRKVMQLKAGDHLLVLVLCRWLRARHRRSAPAPAACSSAGASSSPAATTGERSLTASDL